MGENHGVGTLMDTRKTSLNLPLPLQFLAAWIGVWLGPSRIPGTARRIAQVLPSMICLNGCGGILAPDEGATLGSRSTPGIAGHVAVFV